MKSFLAKRKLQTLSIIFLFIFSVFVPMSPAFAETTTTNPVDCADIVVPDPIGRDCNKEAVSFGNLINRFVQFIPTVITLLSVFGVGRGAFKVILSDDGDKAKEGFKGVINVALGAGLFYSIWIILYLIEQFTGAPLNIFNN
jgi:hypothetical protein